ncbi:sialate O-acetylesterase [Coraliomargarita parva]|uniref:sialate O-acetylesterase n=1 Tax=Coraliomargarita parva TaxID=3014050 RepID=UPI0022B42ABC|nr:sialate O-acetylesterase [Coraliomargarita parva]
MMNILNRKYLSALCGFTCLASTLLAAEVIQRDGWSFDRSQLTGSEAEVAAAIEDGLPNEFAGWMEYDFEVSDAGWYALYLRCGAPSWSHDVFVDGVTYVRLQGADPEDVVPNAPKDSVNFKEINVYLSEGMHTLRLQRNQFPANLPSLWELRPAEDAGDTVRVWADESRLLDTETKIKIKIEGGASFETSYDVYWEDLATGELTSIGTVQFPKASAPIIREAELSPPGEGFYTIRAKVNDALLTNADFKSGFFLVQEAKEKKTRELGFEFSALFRSGAVLQRDMELPVWGWATPDSKVTVELAGQKLSTQSQADGRWQVTFEPIAVGGPYELTATSGDKTLKCYNILMGDVWLLSGQSNLGGPLKSATGAVEYASEVDYPDVRITNNYPDDLVTDQHVLRHAYWNSAVFGGDVSKMYPWKAIHYAFGRDIHEALGVPVGLIDAGRGGTIISTWMSQEAHEALPSLRKIAEAYETNLDEAIYELDYLNKVEAEVLKWRKLKEAGKAKTKKPKLPTLYPPRNFPSKHYDQLIAPMAPFALKGILWYQGESDSPMAACYEERFKLMIQEWRELFDQPDLAFLYVQIAYGSGKHFTGPAGDYRQGELKEAQTAALDLPNTAMVVTDDLMTPEDDVHYLDKLPVGHRLARAALNTVYGKEVPYQGPTFREFKIEGDAIRVYFDHAKGLSYKGEVLNAFSIAGDDRQWHWADARIDGETVIVSSPEVPNPVAVRYSWSESTRGSQLINKHGLPTPVFRTDDWPKVTEGVDWVREY